MIKYNEDAMIRSASDTAMPDNLIRQVHRVRRSSQARDQRYAWLIAASVLAITMIVAMVVEAQLNLFSHSLRFALTAVSLLATAICGRAFWRRGKKQNERLISAAERVDSTFPALEQRVSTLTSCEEDRLKSKLTAHPAMLNRLATEAASIHETAEPKPIASKTVFTRPLICLAAAAVVMIGLIAWDAPKTMVQLGRFWAPWSNFSVTNVSSVEKNSVVARHEPIKLTAALAGRPVEELQFISQTVEDAKLSEARLWPSVKDPSVATFRQSKAVESFDYRFRAGDGQTQWHRVTVADRPGIESLKMRIVPPAYTGKPTQTFAKLPKKLRVVQGSQLEIEVTSKADVRTARLVMGKTDWLPMELTDGRAYQGTMELRQPVRFQVQLTELHGLVNRRPPSCYLQVVSDQAPRVKIVSPTKTAVLLPDETINIHFKASDDFGIKEMALRVYTQKEGEDQPTVHEVPIPLSEEDNRRKISGSVALDLTQFNLDNGDTVRYEVRASDNFMPGKTPLGDPQTQPMKSVELARNSGAPTSQDNTNQSGNTSQPGETSQSDKANQSAGADQTDPMVAEGQVSNPSEKVAQATGAENPSDQASRITNDPSTKTAQANPSQAPSANGNSSAQSQSPGKNQPPGQNQTAKNSSGGMSASGNTSPDDRSDDPSADKNEIRISQTPENSTSESPDPNSIAKSDPTMNRGTPSESANAGTQSNSGTQSNTGTQPNSGNPSNQSSQASSGQPGNSQQTSQSSSNQGDPSGSNQMAGSENQNQDPDQPEAANNRESSPSKSDPVQMAKRSLDVGGQSSSSGQQQIKVDQYIGGFASENRNKLEIAIAPIMETLKKSLVNAGENVRRVMNPTAADPTTDAVAVKFLQGASSELQTGSEAVIELNKKTKNTPYAFVGLRLESIRTADVVPARDDVEKAIDTDGQSRLSHSSTAWNHINRALGMLEKLEAEFEQTKRQLKRAEDIQRFKKMHRLFIENSLAMLNPKNPSLNNGQSRKAVEFDLDEEYLERLKEVLQLRRDMMAELARILADDPQLLRRFMNMMNSRTATIRDQLTLISRDQQALAGQVNAWADASKNPQDLKGHVVDETERHLAEIQGLANRLADVQDAFVSWLPLAEDVKKGDAAEAMENFNAAGSNLTGMVADVDAIFANGQQSPNYGRLAKPLLDKATDLDNLLAGVSKSLQRMSDDQIDIELANNAIRRFPDLQKIRFDAQQWAGKLELLINDGIHETYSVNQENRRAQLLEYSVKIASLDSQLLGALRDPDGELPDEVAAKSKELQNLLDIEIPAQQLIAAQTLSDRDANSATTQQNDIATSFERAEKLFDEILQAIADELDELPADDPIASMLDDPTLDEILAQLENELDTLESLGLSGPRTNLQVINDWKSNRMASRLKQLQEQQQRMRNLSNQAYRNALIRARVKSKRKSKPKLTKDDQRWHLLVGQLDENMLQGDKKIPPERYRSAIDRYFETISKLKNGQDSQ